MRGHCVYLVAILTIVPSTVWAASDGIPTLDVRPVCQGIASQSADPGVGQRNQTETFQQCIESEEAVREQLKQVWSAFSAADKRHCVTLATTGGESSNTELLTCLEMARDVRVLRSASSGKETAKPSSLLSMPAAQPAATGPIPEKEAPKKKTMKRKVKSSGQRRRLKLPKHRKRRPSAKLPDAEAALKKAKEEAQRATAEVERAKAEAQNARKSRRPSSAARRC